MGIIVDLHCHMLGYRKPNSVSLEQIGHFRRHQFGFFADPAFEPASERDFETEYVENLAQLARQSKHADRVVLLAMDRPYDHGPEHFYVDNEFLAKQVARFSNELLFGASVNPAREDSIDALNYVSSLGAVLIKVLQNSMRVDLSDKSYDRFFETMANLGMLLLVHSGNESTVLGCEHTQESGDPRKLQRAIDIGVKVVVSHCGAPEYFDDLLELVDSYDNVYGGLAAMGRRKRHEYLLRLTKMKGIHHKLVFETDYPLPPDPDLFKSVPALTRNTGNFFDLYIGMLMNLGFSADILYKGAELINVF